MKRVEILLFLVLALMPGVAHPDEMMQSLQPLLASPLVCGDRFDVDLPWEYGEAAARSILPWHLILGWIPGICTYPLIIQRVVFTLLSLLMVTVVVPEQARLTASFAFLFFTSRPYSNTLEWYLICALWYIVFKCKNTNGVLVGVLAVSGCFVRITFPAFATPIILWWWFNRNFSIVSLFQLVLGGLISLSSFVIYDSWHYGKWVLTPLNNLMYNSRTENLAQHGLHPRYQHFLINTLLMFGPFWLWALPVIFKRLKRGGSDDGQILVSACMVVVSLTTLSIFPHQEPRFLLPLLLPLAHLQPHIVKSKFWFKILVITQMLVAIFFASVHQSGSISCLSTVSNHTCIVWWKMYPLPSVLTKTQIVDATRMDLAQVYGDMKDHDCLLAKPAWIHVPDLVLVDRCWWPHIGLDQIPDLFAAGLRSCYVGIYQTV
jgi:GPI mannosyltransferase 4